MEHWLVVGHFDPLDLVDTSEKPYRPKPLRPIPHEAVECAEQETGRDISEYLSHGNGGCVYCYWSVAHCSLWDRIRQFAFFLAERERAVVIDEMYVVLWPDEARIRQQQSPGSMLILPRLPPT